jgi:hypothetical protein
MREDLLLLLLLLDGFVAVAVAVAVAFVAVAADGGGVERAIRRAAVICLFGCSRYMVVKLRRDGLPRSYSVA